jgi:hypothetical protein
MDALNTKIRSSRDDNYTQAQVVGVTGYNSTLDRMKIAHMTDANELKVAVSQHLVDAPDMRARTNISDPATSTPLKCDAAGKLEVEATLELDSSSLAKEAKQDTMITDLGQIATNTSRLAPQLNRTEAIPVQIMVGSGGTEYDALRANGQDLMVMIDDMNPDVAVNSGLSTATKQDTMITHLADIDNQTNGLLTYQVQINQTQTNGNQVVKCMGNNGGNNVQLKVDANGVLETSGGGGGGGTQYNMGDAIGATPTGTVSLGRDSSGNAQALQVSTAGDLFVELTDFAKGQTNMASSFCVNVANDQSRLDVDTVKDEVVISQANQAITNGNAFTSTAVDMRGYKTISFLGTSTNNTDVIKVLFSVDDIVYYDSGQFLTQDFTTGDFGYTATLGIRYVKLTQASTDFNSNFTITCISSKK